MSYYGKTTTGDVLSRLTNDVDTIGQSLNQSVGNLVSAVTMLAGCLWMMFTTNVIMTLTAVLASLIGFGFMALVMGRSQKYFTAQQNHLGEINGGDILLDGNSIKKMRREDVHNQFCMVLQDTWLFEGTIRENLVYNAEGIPDSRLDEVCRAVGLYHFIRTLPDGYDTVLNDHVALSLGQKQQMTIARAMLSDKPMLILDEATSSVDTRTEQKIQSAMDALMKGRTSFVIAHRLSTIKNADMILVLKDGDVIERGTHKELLKQGGFYAELYNSQFEQAS